MTDRQKLDDIARRYHASTDVPDKHIEDLCQVYTTHWILDHLSPGTSVLELGFGEGIVTRSLCEAGMDVTVIEGSSVLHDTARARFGNRINIVNALFEEYSPRTPFDLVLASHVLEHVADPVALLRRMKAWVNQDGRVIVIVPNSTSVHRRLAVLMGLQPQMDTLGPRDHLVGHLRVYSHESLRQDLEAGGFRVVEETGFFLKTLPNSMMLDYSKELLQAMNEIAHHLPKEILANIGVVAVPA